MAVTGWIVHGMREVMAGNVAVGWKRRGGELWGRSGGIHVTSESVVYSRRSEKEFDYRHDDTKQKLSQPTTDQEDAHAETQERHDATEDRKRVANVSGEYVGQPEEPGARCKCRQGPEQSL